MEVRLHPSGLFYSTEPDPATGEGPAIGDLRISYFKRVGSGVVSVLGALAPHKKDPNMYRLTEYSLRGTSLFPVCIRRRLARVTWIKPGKVSAQHLIDAHVPAMSNGKVWLARCILAAVYIASSHLILLGIKASLRPTTLMMRIANFWMPLADVTFAAALVGISLSFAHMFSSWVICTALIITFATILLAMCVA